jgi:hypothetical protein
MKHFRTILAAILSLTLPAAGQTIKSLGYNTTNGNIVYSGTNPLTFTNAPAFSQAAAVRTNLGLGTINNVTFGSVTTVEVFVDDLSVNASAVFGTPIEFGGTNFAGYAAATRTNLGLGATWLTNNNVTNFRTAIGLGTTNYVAFSGVEIISSGDELQIDGQNISSITYGHELNFEENRFTSGTNNLFGWTTTNVNVAVPATFSTNVTVSGTLTAASIATSTPVSWSLDAVQTAAATNGVLDLPLNANVLRITNANTISAITNGRLGAFYYIVNQSGTNLVLSNSSTLTTRGGGTVTLAPNQSATLLSTSATNATLQGGPSQLDSPTFAGLTTTGNVTMSGTANTAPNQTAASGSSIMTRDLVGQELALPRDRMQTTYWFGLEGLGQWGAVGQSPATSYQGTADGNGIGGGQLIYSTAGIGVSAAGAGLRLGSGDPYGTTGIFTVAGSGDTIFRVRLRKNTSVGLGPAMAFVMGTRTATTMWQNNAPGIYYVPQPTNSWAADAVVAANHRIAVSNVVFAVSTAGTNGSVEPTWPDAINSLVTNGSAVYRNVGPHTSNNWVLAIGSTNASQVVMTNTGKVGPTSTAVASYVLTFRVNGTTNVFAKVQTGTANGNTAGESSEVSLGTSDTSTRFQPQIWSRDDVGGGSSVDPVVRYISIDGPLGSLP